MPKSYSADLRKRVIEAVASGVSRHEAAKVAARTVPALVELFAPSSRVFALTNVPTISGIQDMFPYDRNPL
jgi:hypothetical protein